MLAFSFEGAVTEHTHINIANLPFIRNVENLRMSDRLTRAGMTRGMALASTASCFLRVTCFVIIT